MIDESTSVVVVLCDVTEERLRELLDQGDVWIAESPVNSTHIKAVWAARALMSYKGDLSTFQLQGDSLDDRLAGVLELIEDHYNEGAAAGSWQRLEVVGQLRVEDVEVLSSWVPECCIQRIPGGVMVMRQKATKST